MFKRYILNQYFFNFKNILLKKSISKELSENGYMKCEKRFSFQNLDLQKYLNYKNFDFVDSKKKINDNDLRKIYLELKSYGIIEIIKNYLGNKIFCYDNSIFTLGKETAKNSAWQPHHDTKGARLKIYIWLDNKNLFTHPLYYLQKSHKNIKKWKNNLGTRFPDLNVDKFDTIFGDMGDIIIFDTHGIHSHYKTSTVPRSVIELTFEPFGLIHRLNSTNIEKETQRLGLKDLDKYLLS